MGPADINPIRIEQARERAGDERNFLTTFDHCPLFTNPQSPGKRRGHQSETLMTQPACAGRRRGQRDRWDEHLRIYGITYPSAASLQVEPSHLLPPTEREQPERWVHLHLAYHPDVLNSGCGQSIPTGERERCGYVQVLEVLIRITIPWGDF